MGIALPPSGLPRYGFRGELRSLGLGVLAGFTLSKGKRKI